MIIKCALSLFYEENSSRIELPDFQQEKKLIKKSQPLAKTKIVRNVNNLQSSQEVAAELIKENLKS